MEPYILNKNNTSKKLIVLELIFLSWLVPWLCAKTPIWFDKFLGIPPLIFLLLNFYFLLKYQSIDISNKKIYRKIIFFNFVFGIIMYFSPFISLEDSGGHGEGIFYWMVIVGPIMILTLILYGLFLFLNIKYLTNLYLVSRISVIITAVYSLFLLLLQEGINSQDIMWLVISGPVIGTIIALVIKKFQDAKTKQ